MAFVAGGLTMAGYSWWLALLPAIWFVGMVFSHAIFRRCVLNEITIRLGRFKRTAAAKRIAYTRPLNSPMKTAHKAILARRLRPVNQDAGINFDGGLLTKIFDT